MSELDLFRRSKLCSWTSRLNWCVGVPTIMPLVVDVYCYRPFGLLEQPGTVSLCNYACHYLVHDNPEVGQSCPSVQTDGSYAVLVTWLPGWFSLADNYKLYHHVLRLLNYLSCIIIGTTWMILRLFLLLVDYPDKHLRADAIAHLHLVHLAVLVIHQDDLQT